MLNIIGLILLWILRIIGLILGLIILLLLIILFVPFRYDANGSYNEKVNVKVKFSWLFRIINGKFTMDEKGQNTFIRIFIFKVYPGKEKKKKPDKKKDKSKKDESKKDKSKKDNKKTDKEKNKIVQEKLDNDEVLSVVTSPIKKEEENSQVSEIYHDLEKKDVKISDNSIEDSSKKEDLDTSKQKKEKKSKKDKEPNKNIEQAKELWTFLQEPQNKDILKFITKYVVKIVKWILPRKVYVDMELGLEDPALTGYIAAVTSIVYVATKKNIHIAPNFNEQVIKGDFRIKGRLYLYQLLYYIIRVIIDKRVRRLIKKVRS